MGNAAQYQTVPNEEDEIPSKPALPLTKSTETSTGSLPESIEAKKKLFINELKQKYKLLYGTSHPIAFIRDKLRCTHKVFVQVGIEILSTSWLPLNSYNDVLRDPKVKSKRRLVQGEIGSGKSALAFQFMYGWCNSVPESYLKDVEILIFLQMRQITEVHSIQKIIKQYLLPRTSELNESDVDTILRSSLSVVFILDGLDEYPDDGDKSDIWKIITAQMFPDFDVILTSNNILPEKYQVEMTQLRLTGFDDKAHFEYIQKAVVGDDEMAAERIKQKLSGNPVLNDLCQLPFFFVMFAHISHNNRNFGTLNTLTSFFKHMIKCFHNHMVNTTKLHDLKESSHSALEKLAFDCVNKENSQTRWRKADLCRRLGDDCYHHYLQIGILVEEKACNARGLTDVTFYHKLFCEWYAAQHFAKCATESKHEKLNKELQHIEPNNHQYFYRFVCGLNHFAAGKIISYLRAKEASDKLAALCILEQGKKVTSILDTVRDLCSKEITLEKEPNKLQQRSIVRVLEIASSNEIPILCVRLYDCYSTVDLSLWDIKLKLHTTIPVLATLKKLWIRETGRKIEANDLEGILHYCSRCLGLEKVWFWGCLLPRSVQADSLSVLKLRNVEVLWRIDNETANQVLNLESGLWKDKNDGNLMTDDDYETLVHRKEWVTE